MTSAFIVPEGYPGLARLLHRQVTVTPQHRGFLEKRFASESADGFRFAETLATWIERLVGDDLDRFCTDYDWICRLVLNEEYNFRRTGRYRLSRFADAYAEVYADSALMRHYMNGLLMTSLWWSNHTGAMRYYCDAYLSQNPSGASHLEIGPGHGLLLALAADRPELRSIEAWDVSPQSIESTRLALSHIGVRRTPDLYVRDLFAEAGAPPRQFDNIVLSEVLEHLEEPGRALTEIRKLMSSRGRLFVNMPINSPAPDHLFLLDTPEEVVAFIESHGFTCTQSRFLPTTNYTLEQARKHKLTVSCLVIARSNGIAA